VTPPPCFGRAAGKQLGDRWFRGSLGWPQSSAHGALPPEQRLTGEASKKKGGNKKTECIIIRNI